MEIEQPVTSEKQLLTQLSDESLKNSEREKIVKTLAKTYTTSKNFPKLETLLEKAKTMAPPDSKMYIAKILKIILDEVSLNDTEDKSIESQMAQKILKWSITEKKQFLINKIRLRFANILYNQSKFRKSLEECQKVLENAKEIDDKRLLVEGHLLESKLIYQKNNLPKAKAALTTCRASANMVYIQPLLIADIEFVAGIIHLAERDYQISYSYFFEAFEAYNQAKNLKKASELFVYLILAKIMQDSIDDAENLVNGRYGVVYKELSEYTFLIVRILKAYKMKDLVALLEILEQERVLIKKDRILDSQIDFLYDQLLERNILKLIRPYSNVEILFLSKKLGVGGEIVEKKICEMILDEKLKGSLDQENGVLLIFQEKKLDCLYTDSLEILGNMNEAVDMLFKKSEKIRGF